MNKLIITSGIASLILISMFMGCTNNSEDEISEALAAEKILGLWRRTNWDYVQTWEFKNDTSLIVYGSNLTFFYGFENNSLFTYIPSIDYFDEYKYKFENNYNELTLSLISRDFIIDPETGEIIDPGTVISDFEITLVRILSQKFTN